MGACDYEDDIEYLKMLEQENKAWAKDFYLDYVDWVHRGQWKPARHNELICDAVQDVAEGRIKRLMIFMPPRHSKSMTITETFPSWYLLRNPDKRVIVVSYGDSLAQRFGKLNRQKINEFGQDLFGLTVSKQKSSMTDFDIADHRGGMISAGIGSGITGMGADLMVIDDPVKNKEEAESKTYRDKIWHEWQNTLRTRLHPGAAVIVILTRWHEDDLAGRLLNPEYGEVEDWTILSLPALAEENDLMGRAVGEPLWPEHGFDLKWAEDTKNAVGSQTWAALYQQRPAPAEGAMLKREWWKFYTEVPEKFDKIVQSWDMSFKDSDGSDFVSGQVWGVIGASIYMLPDREYGRMDFVKTVGAVRALSERNPKAITKLIEDKANGSAVISMLRKEIRGIIPVNPKSSKIARVSAVSPLIEAGNVFLPAPALAPWITDFIEECAAFPNGAHDDMTDTCTMALSHFMYAKAKQKQVEKKWNWEHEKPTDGSNIFTGGAIASSFVNYGLGRK